MATDVKAYEKIFSYSKVKDNHQLYLAWKWFGKKIYFQNISQVLKVYFSENVLCQICNIEKIQTLQFFPHNTFLFEIKKINICGYLRVVHSLPNYFFKCLQRTESLD